MSELPIHHACVLNLHQPAGNLEDLLENQTWEAKEILWAMDRMPRSLWGYEDVARIHVVLSGTLLETLSDPAFQERVYGIAKVGDLLWQLQNLNLFRLTGTAYYHPVLPLIPRDDWEDHLTRWLGKAQHLFGPGRHFQGFWPPEMGFTMELIPLLKRLGYRYVFVDSNNVEGVDSMEWHEMVYRPHIAEFEGEEIVVIVRDRDLSNAQESGMEPGWFLKECQERTKHCEFPPLVVTASDGDNGGWFRNTTVGTNFWEAFYRPFCEQARAGETRVRPAFVDHYLDRYGAHGRVKVHKAAWNTGWHHGWDFVQWTGSDAQKHGFAVIADASRAWVAARQQFPADRCGHEVNEALEEARWRLLRAETSCHFYWGEAWVERAHKDLEAFWGWLHRAGEIAGMGVAP